MIEGYNLPGFYILRPWAFSIWEFVQNCVGDLFVQSNVKNVSLPLFVPFMDKLGERYNTLAPHVSLF